MTNELTSDQRDQALSQIPLGNFGSDTDIAKLTYFYHLTMLSTLQDKVLG